MRAYLAVLGCLLLASLARADDPWPMGDAARGERLAGLAGCGACHTADGGVSYAGGHVVHTPQGDFVGSNLTPDPTHGLGAWTVADLARALRDGKAPDGRVYWPAFPYTSFTGLTDAEVADLWAFLRTLPPSDRADEPQRPARGLTRGLVRTWRAFHFRRGPRPAPDDPVLARGAHLVEVVGHCGECHTPRTSLGALRTRWTLAGSEGPPTSAPNLTPSADGLGAWSVDDVVTYLELGMEPDGDFAGGEMARVVREGTAPLTEADRAAIAAYLATLPPRPDR